MSRAYWGFGRSDVASTVTERHLVFRHCSASMAERMTDEERARLGADYAEGQLTSPGDCVALVISYGTPPLERAGHIDFYELTLEELRRRGLPVFACTLPDPNATVLAISLAAP